MHDYRYDFTHRLAIAPQVISDPGETPNPVEGDAIDLAAHQGVNIVFAFGETTDGTGDKLIATPYLEVTDDPQNGPWIEPEDGSVLGPDVTVAEGTNDESVWTLGYIGDHRYVRAVIEATGENGTMPVSAVAILMDPQRKPVVEDTPEDVA